MSTHKVFVYGTLKSGESNHRLLSRATYVGPGTTVAPFAMKNTGGYPMVIKDKGGTPAPIAGEIYEVDPATFADLDRLEGHPHFFCREEIHVDVQDSGVLDTCWMYFVPHSKYSDGLPDVVPAAGEGVINWSGRR